MEFFFFLIGDVKKVKNAMSTESEEVREGGRKVG